MKLLLQLCRFDILAITETHLDINVSNRQLEIVNYKIARGDRNAGTLGGGCLVYIANRICSTRMKSLECPTIESIWLRVNINSTQFIIGTIYRPPSSLDFFNNFHKTLEKVWLRFTNVLIVGDFNCTLTTAGYKNSYNCRLQEPLQPPVVRTLAAAGYKNPYNRRL